MFDAGSLSDDVTFVFLSILPALENLLIVDVLLPGSRQQGWTSQTVMVTFSHQVANLALRNPRSAENCSISSAFLDKSANVSCTNLSVGVPYEVRVTGTVMMTNGMYPLEFSLLLTATGTEDNNVKQSWCKNGFVAHFELYIFSIQTQLHYQ